MFNRKQKEIDSLNARCAELAKMVKDKNEELKIQRHSNELIDTVKRINLLATYDGYENNEAFRRKLKELTSDYQSIC